MITPCHEAIINHLGWKNMAAHVALPAANQIIGNYITALSDRDQNHYEPEEVIGWLASLSPNDVFGFLGLNDDPNYVGSPQEKRFIELKPFFEFIANKSKDYHECINNAMSLRSGLEGYAVEQWDLCDILPFWGVDELPRWAEVYIEDYVAKFDAWCEERANAECPGDNL